MKDLKTLVYEEADKLLLHATKEERSKLDFETLDGSYIDLCIYGQMTKNCNSKRAVELLNLCAKPFSVFTSKFINSYLDDFYYIDRDFSTIEFFIHQNNSTPQERKELIDYLKKDL